MQVDAETCGRRLAVWPADSGASADPAIYRLNVAGGQPERVVGLKEFRRVVQPWASWMGLTPGGSPLLMRDTGTQEAYALDFEAP